MRTRNATLVVRLPADVKAALRRAAVQTERTMSKTTVLALRLWLAAEGYLPATKQGRVRK
jgi:hypothetical protein